MKIRYLPFLLFLLFFSCACRKKPVIREVIIDESLFHTIQIDPSENQNTWNKISDIAESISFIPLYTSDDVLVGEITKMIIWNDCFYIWDRITETVFCFDSEGQFVNKINKRGLGPGEYPRIYDFTIDRTNGNICIYSDEGQGIYEYANDGTFIKKIPVKLSFYSFAVKNEDTLFYYCGKSINSDHFRSTFPEQYRYLVMNNNEVINQQLPYTYRESHKMIPSSKDVFTCYNDTILMAEHLTGEIYSIDGNNQLTPRYRIEFLTNTYHFSFEKEVDMKQMNSADQSGNWANLHGSFYETDRYIFFNYARSLIGLAYVNKQDNSIHNLAYFILDDFNELGVPPSLLFVDEDYIYTEVEPGSLIQNIKKKGEKASLALQDLGAKITETDNPVIEKIKLKQP